MTEVSKSAAVNHRETLDISGARVAAGSSITARTHIELEPADNQCRAKGTRAARKWSIGGKESGEKRETAIYAGAGWSRVDGQRIDTPR